MMLLVLLCCSLLCFVVRGVLESAGVVCGCLMLLDV